MSGPFQHRRPEQILTAEIGTVHTGASRVEQSPIYGLEHWQSYFLRFFRISLHDLYQLHPRTEAFAPME